MKKRLPELDDIRGISIFVMILIHTNAYFLSDWWSAASREVSQFAVVAFIFCSAYLFFQKPMITSVKDFFVHLLKRMQRLLIPYYWFLLFYLGIDAFRKGKMLPFPSLLQNITLVGGIDFNWLVLLFIQLTICMSLVGYLKERNKVGLVIYTVLDIVSSIIFLKFTPLSSYRNIMWLPWSLIIVYAAFFDQLYNNKKYFYGITAIMFIIFWVTMQYVLIPLHHSVSMFDNKYPPNVYHLAYSIFVVNLLYLFSKWGLFKHWIVQIPIHFFSIYSYSIFFIHVIVIYVVTVFFHFNFNWVTFFLTVTIVSALVQVALNGVFYLFSTLKRGPTI